MADFIHRITVPIIFFFSSVMFLAVIAQVVFRYVLTHPLPWSEELARYLMIWVACLASSEAYRMKSHVGIDFIVKLMPPVFKKVVVQFAHLSIFVLMAVITWQGVKLSWLLMEQASPALEIPMSIPYLAVPVGSFLIAFHALAFFIQEFRDDMKSQ